jgi:hypothetical protein
MPKVKGQMVENFFYMRSPWPPGVCRLTPAGKFDKGPGASTLLTCHGAKSVEIVIQKADEAATVFLGASKG